MRLDAQALDEKRFTQEHCDRLFAAVLINDEVDTHTELPDHVRLDYDAAQLIDCFRLCRQLWQTGVRRDVVLNLTRKLAVDHDLGAEDRLLFKHARAKFKHLRFAYALYSAGHRYPILLNWITTAMGHLQDAFKNSHGAAVSRQAVLGRFFLSPLPQTLLAREVGHFTPTTTKGFRTYIEQQVTTLREVLAQDFMTGHQFHATRKIISRQVSFYDTLRTIDPSSDSYKMSRSLSAINGLMGQMHDVLVERRVAGTQDYHRESFHLPDDIRRRLIALVDRYPA
jgi:hypothetical protein